MTKYITLALIVCACAVTAAQFNHLGLGFSDGYHATNFGPPNLNALSAAARDPRANTGPTIVSTAFGGLSQGVDGNATSFRLTIVGPSDFNLRPVVFPPSPPGDPSQSSGVVVGASGYGFQPPDSVAPRYFYRGFYRRR